MEVELGLSNAGCDLQKRDNEMHFQELVSEMFSFREESLKQHSSVVVWNVALREGIKIRTGKSQLSADQDTVLKCS